jgi:ferric-dicitrate binding protein FerR (iron transport regulator)
MEKQRLSWLVQQYMAEQATLQELQELAGLVRADTDKELFTTVMAEMMEQENPVVPADGAMWQQMIQDIIAIDKPIVPQIGKRSAGIFKLYKWVAAAVVVLVMTGVAVYFFALHTKQPPRPGVGQTMPGLAVTPVNKNVLVLSTGSQVLLDETPDGTIATYDNATITKQGTQITYASTGKNGDTWYNVLSTAKSSMYQVVLPDGSHVWLNAASSIRFPASFTGNERLVELSGEAWFDVQHADQIPFLIRTGAVTTAVMGTAFDIKAYPGQRSLIVSVQRGIVKIQAGNKTLTTLIKGQQVRVQADTSFSTNVIDTAAVAAWKQGNLIYKDELVKDIMADLQRVFKDTIVIKRAALKQETITVSFNKSSGLQQALEIICRITDARLTKQHGTFIIE